jgi:glycosyltransferase involved in cell wall biosynthesis
VEAFVQKIMPAQQPIGGSEYIDGVKVTTLPRNKLAKLRSKLYLCDADVLHSQNSRLDTYFAFKQNPDVPKVVTIQDLRTNADLDFIGRFESYNTGFVKRQWNHAVDLLYRNAMLGADVLTCQADLLRPKIREVYGLDGFRILPNFVDVPSESLIKKSVEPSVVFLGRLDKVKRPELFFKMADFKPWVTFYVLGEAHDSARNIELKRLVSESRYNNIKLLGFQDGAVKNEVLSKEWVLINTSRYECLPVSFLEALSYKCALLSTVNPDNYTSMFGRYCASEGYSDYLALSNLTRELTYLLSNDCWRVLGEQGYKFVKAKHSTEVGVANHIRLYESLIKHEPVQFAFESPLMVEA